MNSVIKSEENHELSTDLNVITAEIRAYQRVAGEAIFEIGRRLKRVRDNPEEYGLSNYRDWERWCHEQLSMTRRNANRFIRVVERFGDTGVPELPSAMSVLYELTSFTDEELAQEYELPSGEKKKPTEMSRREIEELKRQLKKEREERERLAKENERLANQPPKVEYIEVRDELTERKLRRYEELFGDLTIYEGKATRVTNGDAITYAVFEFSEDVRKFLEKYSYLTHFAREFNQMIDEGKEEYQKSIDALRRFLQAVERNLNEKELIILEG